MWFSVLFGMVLLALSYTGLFGLLLNMASTIPKKYDTCLV